MSERIRPGDTVGSEGRREPEEHDPAPEAPVVEAGDADDHRENDEEVPREEEPPVEEPLGPRRRVGRLGSRGGGGGGHPGFQQGCKRWVGPYLDAPGGCGKQTDRPGR